MVERLSASGSGMPDLSQHRDHLVGEIAKLQKRHTVRIAKDDTLVWARTWN